MISVGAKPGANPIGHILSVRSRSDRNISKENKYNKF